jgi:hypothetical protein
MSADWLVQEFEVRENWKFTSVETPEAQSPKAEEPKWWGTMMSPGGDVDPGILKLHGLQTSPRMTWTHGMCATCQ